MVHNRGSDYRRCNLEAEDPPFKIAAANLRHAAPQNATEDDCAAKNRKIEVEDAKSKNHFKKIGAANVQRAELQSTGDEWSLKVKEHC